MTIELAERRARVIAAKNNAASTNIISMTAVKWFTEDG
jgi:hypothetical protein